MYLQSMNSDKYLPKSLYTVQFFKMTTFHFAVYLFNQSMVKLNTTYISPDFLQIWANVKTGSVGIVLQLLNSLLHKCEKEHQYLLDIQHWKTREVQLIQTVMATHKTAHIRLTNTVSIINILILTLSFYFNPHQNDQGWKGPGFFQRLIALKCLKCQKI